MDTTPENQSEEDYRAMQQALRMLWAALGLNTFDGPIRPLDIERILVPRVRALEAHRASTVPGIH